MEALNEDACAGLQIMNELVQGLGLRGVEKVTVIRERKTGMAVSGP